MLVISLKLVIEFTVLLKIVEKIMVEALLFMKCFNILMVNLVLKKFVD